MSSNAVWEDNLTHWEGRSVISPNSSFSLSRALLKARQASKSQNAVDPDYPDSPLTSFPATPVEGDILSPSNLISGTDLCAALKNAAAASIKPPLSTAVTRTGATAVREHKHHIKVMEKARTESQARRKDKQRVKSRENYRKKRTLAKQEGTSEHASRPSLKQKHVDSAQPVVVSVPMEAMKSRVASTSYVGLNDSGTRSKAKFSVGKLVGDHGFQYVAWDGCNPVPIFSQDGFLMGVLAGNPDPTGWPRVQQDASNALDEARLKCSVKSEDRRHRRGNFTALKAGVSHGGGPKKPSNAANNKINADILHQLNNLEAFKRISGFTNSVMRTWAPNLYDFYKTYVKAVFDSDSNLKEIFPSSVFTATTYNLGPQTVCHKHIDFANLPFGWCGITALGSYDHTKGGHLVLWDLHLVIEFPPGATALIPSAIVAHSNIAVSKNEKRYSFTQYTAGALFRWVDNGFQLARDYEASLEGDAKIAYDAAEKGRWMYGLSLLPRRSTSKPS